jgi:hypothetical protein
MKDRGWRVLDLRLSVGSKEVVHRTADELTHELVATGDGDHRSIAHRPSPAARRHHGFFGGVFVVSRFVVSRAVGGGGFGIVTVRVLGAEWPTMLRRPRAVTRYVAPGSSDPGATFNRKLLSGAGRGGRGNGGAIGDSALPLGGGAVGR